MSLTAEQLELRRTFVGGSEIAAILGLSPFMGPLDVYLSKVEGYQREATPDMERGIYLEDGVAQWFAARTGTEVREVGTLRDPVHPHVGCTPDRLFNTAGGQSRLLSIKVPGNWLSEEWGEPHAWRVPTGYYLQLQYEMGVCGALGLCLVDYAKLAAPLAGDLQILDVPFDAEVSRRMCEEAEAFWARHVVTKTPPPLDGSEGAKQWLRRRFPDSPNPIRAATPAEDVLAIELQSTEQRLEVADDAYQLARQRIEEAIGPAEGIDGPFGRVTFKANKKGVRSLRTTWTTQLHNPEEKAA